MEKKTIGSFIAALRKANGMTQRDLAERLNVSDKTVSRWECNDGVPDLSIIPIIADIFHVTCDELLRGEKNAPSEPTSPPSEYQLTPKATKQTQYLLNAHLAKYRKRTWISIGIAIGGLIAAMVVNIGFLRAYLGCLAGVAFYVTSLISQAIWINNAFSAASDDSWEDPGKPVLGTYRYRVIRFAEYAIGLTIVLFGATLPLLILPQDTYVGLTARSWFAYGAFLGTVVFLIYCTVCYFLNFALLQKNIYTLPEKEAKRYHNNHKLQRNCAIALLPILLITLFAHVACTEIWGPWSIMKGTTFHDYESFVAYMEQDIPYPSDSATATAMPSDDVEFDYDISWQEPYHETLKDDQGNVVCEYLDRNQSVCSIRYTNNPNDGSLLPITVYTYEDLQQAQSTVVLRHIVFVVVYGFEIFLTLGIYFRKRNK